MEALFASGEVPFQGSPLLEDAVTIVTIMCVSEQAQLIQMVVWMLQHRLLFQIHTYVYLMVPPIEEEPGLREEEPSLVTRVTGRSLSTPSALSFGSPSMQPS